MELPSWLFPFICFPTYAMLAYFANMIYACIPV